MNRRTFIQTAVVLAAGYPLSRWGGLISTPQFTADPFAAGVASGDPTVDGFILWTRLIADPNRERSWQQEAIPVDWEVAHDEAMTQVVQRGTEMALPGYGHSVHVNVAGLDPNRWYWYRFRAGSAVSPTGRTRTAPAGPVDRLRFAFASCQNFQHGYFTAHQNLVREDLDFIVFLGDYIYESGGTSVRTVPEEEPVTLAGYRDRYALYRSDPNLQEAHRLFPWIITWDDHEVDDNYAAGFPKDDQPPDEFLNRRAAAYQAHYEWLPLPPAVMPANGHSRLYRRVPFGPLASFLVLDGRQFRSDQACGDRNKAPCDDSLREDRTMLGLEQEQWLTRELRAATARWNILANQVRMTVVDVDPGPGEIYSMDQWAGYEPARQRLVSSLADVRNPVVITGDIHTNWVGDLKVDYADERSPVVGTELIGTSISTGGDGVDTQAAVTAYLDANPHIKFFNAQRGYVRCTVTPEALTADFRVVDKVSVPDSAITTRATFVVEDGRPGAIRG